MNDQAPNFHVNDKNHYNDMLIKITGVTHDTK